MGLREHQDGRTSVPLLALQFIKHSQDSRSTDTFEINRERAIDYLNTKHRVYVFDGFAGVSFPSPSVARNFIHIT